MMFFVALQCDLDRGVGMPDDTAISEFAQDTGFVPKWYRTSAKTGEGIDEAMRMMLKYIMAVDSWNRPLRDVKRVRLKADQILFRDSLLLLMAMTVGCTDLGPRPHIFLVGTSLGRILKLLLSHQISLKAQYLSQIESHTIRNPDEDEATSAVTTLNGATLVEAPETVKLEDNAERRGGRTCNC